jgi:hypothetical protein
VDECHDVLTKEKRVAIILHPSIDKTVNTVDDRNAIQYKVDNMLVTVLDAIDDPNAGAGVAVYRYSETLDRWILISTENVNYLKFVTEELTITNGGVVPSYVPSGNQVWDVVVVDGDVIVADIHSSDITITPTRISGLTTYDGKRLRFTYAYGTITAQLESYVDYKLQQVVEDVGTYEEFNTAFTPNLL